MNNALENKTMEEINIKELWENVLVDVELNISKANFSTWFKDTYITKIENNIVCLSVPNEFARMWLFDKYHKLLIKTLRNLMVGIRNIEYVVRKDNKKDGDGARKQNINMELPLDEFYINKEDNLNPRYTFENFVVGPFNELAHAAAQAVAQKPGIVYNPLFIYGGSGHGKTHLIQSIGNRLKKRNDAIDVFYTTSEKFAIDYINAVRSNKVNMSFKEKYRKYDVLIIDDIQFLSGMEKTREELFHLFNALYDNNKQIIFSSDKHPNFIPNMENRLKSRFSAGMVVDIPKPDHESRIAILKAKSLQNKFQMNNDIADYLALTVQGNIRELEGVLNSIMCQSQLKGKDFSLNDVKIFIKNNVIKQKNSISIKDVVKQVADFYNIEESMIYKKTRVKDVVRPRQIIMYILRECFNIPYPAIGQKLGGRDHSTVIHSCEKIKNKIKVDGILSREIDQLKMILN